MNNISTLSMVEVAETFQDSVTYCLSNLVGDTKQDVQKFIVTLILQEKPYIITTMEGIPHLVDLVFSSATNRDFIFNLHFVFFSRWGNTEEELMGLITNLARGIALSGTGGLNAMPRELNSRLIDLPDAANLLNDNKWIVIILLMQLFISVEGLITKPGFDK